MKNTYSVHDGETTEVDPFDCTLWHLHDRLPELLDESSCREVIESFEKNGQKLPVLARPAAHCTGAGFKYEVIYGARRLFAAKTLNIPLLARIRRLTDREAIVEMDIENRVRKNTSPYERGMSFRAWLAAGQFESQEELAKTLGISSASVSRLLKFSELPAVVMEAFPDVREIREAWAVDLAGACGDIDSRRRLLKAARTIRNGSPEEMDSAKVYRTLRHANQRPTQASARDDVVRDTNGNVLFRISYRHQDIHIVIQKTRLTAQELEETKRWLQLILSPDESLNEASRRSQALSGSEWNGKIRHLCDSSSPD